MTEENRSGPGRTIAIALAGAVALALVAAWTLGGGEPAGDPDGLETGPVVVAGEGLPGRYGAFTMSGSGATSERHADFSMRPVMGLWQG